MKEFTLILYFNNKFTVCSTNNVNNFLKDKKKHYNDLQVLMYFCGDYRQKIRRFGVKNYLRSKNAYNWVETLNLQLTYDRGRKV